jgi:protein-disulfide isomerase
MRRYLPFAIIAAVFLIAIGSGLVLLRWKQPPSAATAPIPPTAPPITPGSSVSPSAPEAPAKPEPETLHVRGNTNAPVTLEEFGDFQCHPCGEFFPKLTKVEEEYGGRLRVVFRHKPLRKHEHAVIAACAAEAAGLQGRFWEMHDLLFQNSARWTKGVDGVGPDASPSKRLLSNVLGLPGEIRDVLITYAQILKLDLERFNQDIDSDEVKARVESDRAAGDARGIDRTPTIYLNGHLLPATSIRTVETLHDAIEAELSGKRVEETAPGSPTATPDQPK